MPDPFQDVDKSGPEFAAYVADAMDSRQSEPIMESIVSDYLGQLEFSETGLTVEIGCGAGAVSRRIADYAAPGRVVGFDPSELLISEAVARSSGRENLTFVQADGASTQLEDGSVNVVVMHTVLTHVADPEPLIGEAFRLLSPGGRLVICDSDFSKGTLRSFENDPLGACSDEFIDGFVTHPHIVGRLRRHVPAAGFALDRFDATSRVVSGDGMKPWVEMSTKAMLERGEIGQILADALVAEHARRVELGTIYGYQVFITLLATKPTEVS